MISSTLMFNLIIILSYIIFSIINVLLVIDILRYVAYEKPNRIIFIKYDNDFRTVIGYLLDIITLFVLIISYCMGTVFLLNLLQNLTDDDLY